MSNNAPNVVMIGLGYIGLPTAALIAKSKTHVHGVDINQKVVDVITKEKYILLNRIWTLLLPMPLVKVI